MICLGPIHIDTKYAPADRETEENLAKQVNLFKKSDNINKFLNKIPAIFLILNKYRQIVYMSDGAFEYTGLESLTSIMGMRPGEMLGCIHHDEEVGGCGTSISCTYCGALDVILKSQKGISTVQDSRLTCINGQKSYDLRIWASPLELNEEEFTIITIQDISSEKRRAIYERLFFHDFANIINGLTLTFQLLQKNPDKVKSEEFMDQLDYYIKSLIEEFNYHRALISAENNTLELQPQSFKSLEIINEMLDYYKNQSIALFKTIDVDPDSENIEIKTDRMIIRRILRNMINNALEATKDSDIITIGCKLKGEQVEFWVNNPGMIPFNVQAQIFQRSFSTKGKNRGLGTYSMKLLSSFLNGSITFTSSDENGTNFKVTLPINYKK